MPGTTPSKTADAEVSLLPLELGQQLRAAWAKNATARNPSCSSPTPVAADYGGPPFGSIYFGPLGWFANREPHFGMVAGSPKLKSFQQRRPEPVLPFAPISSQPQLPHLLPRTVLLPPGTLPPKRTRSFDSVKASRILLFKTIPISLRRMRELIQMDKMHPVRPGLPQSVIDEARSIVGPA